MLRPLFLSALVVPAVAEVRAAEASCHDGQGTCGDQPFSRDNLLLQMEHVPLVSKSQGIDTGGDQDLPLKPEWAVGMIPDETVEEEGGLGLVEETDTFGYQPTAKEREHFNLVKRARQQGFRCPDGTYYPPNNDKFEFDCRLMRAARGWSKRQATEGFAGHTHKGSNSCKRTEAEGYPKNRGCGENLALGKPGAAEAIKQLQESNGHCRNMYEPAFNMLGVGFYEYSRSTYKYYWTDAFGAWHQGPDQACIGGSPAPSPAPGCADIDTSNCLYYRDQGYCDKSATVMRDCKDTCGIGGCGGGGGSCQDTAGHCEHYKGLGYCNTSPNVKEGCKKTCGLCR